ncbi:RAD51-associated protein 1 [Polymixia lowei]
MTLSLLHAVDGKEDRSPSNKEDVKDQLPADEITDPSSPHLSNCSVNSTLLGLDKITAAQGSPCTPSRQRRADSKATEKQRSKLKDEDEDYLPKLTAESESDNDFSEQAESEDEEFTVRKVNKTSKKGKKTKNEKTRQPPVLKKEKQLPKAAKPKSQATAASTPVRSPLPPKLTAEPRRPASSTTASTSKPLSPAGGRIPKWNPPGQIGRSPTSSQNTAVKSPGQGLRLGLSRRVRVKPLHPGVASH